MKIIKIWMILFGLFCLTGSLQARERWSEQKAQHWYANQSWLVGSNYIPANAVNQLEMWQANTFDPDRIDLELSWAEKLGMNTMRVFLHDLLWQQDQKGFINRINIVLDIAQKHKIRIIFVIFDSCWDANPHLGKQENPIPGVHNSRWVKSPGKTIFLDRSKENDLKAYVTGIISAFANDSRILAWDVWNEPYNVEYGETRLFELLPKVFLWARSANPTQPLTSGMTRFPFKPIEIIQLVNSDIISFHSYDPADEFEKIVHFLQQYHRPIFCTEYMARTKNSTFQSILPITKKYNIAAINWGFAKGKTQTIYPWDSIEHPYSEEPSLWFHDIFWSDGKPYSNAEVELIHDLIYS